MGLLRDVEQGRLVCIALEEGPEEGVAETTNLQSPLHVGRLNTSDRVIGLRRWNNRDQQVEHEDNQEEADEEENNPVHIAEIIDLIRIEVANAGAEGYLPDGEPLLEVCRDGGVELIEFKILWFSWVTTY